jgi:hypothetical protein
MREPDGRSTSDIRHMIEEDKTSWLETENESLKHMIEEAERSQLENENESLKEEISAMWQDLRRLEPSSIHVYGALSDGMAREHSGPSKSRLVELPCKLTALHT